MNALYEQLVEQIKKIDRTDLKEEVSQKPELNVIREQKVWIWLRVYLKDEVKDIREGDKISIIYLPSGEKLESQFLCFGKKNSNKDSKTEGEIQAQQEDDPKTLILMINESDIKIGTHIPFIRTLFNISPHYQFQVYRREELQFTNERTEEVLEYIDCDF